ncbi:spectrin alpha chain, non-erythrocytic 1 isoform X3 [Phlebotomus papatasi]|uniref:spectrin alpha chain, non-erythrocytic 1 isoform X3 n=1 Tax=Phlebotomus papatasi TaxID=29031 RepID=UPI00248354B7|nr:spectrin alpha chain, non-erythrocytic 1 isoform X3 [Phlebotomus papatasi]XP_055716449.1 spectrin alpha chain, non-erythrocytic 1 isoform X3 [Phlebotomus papatasi]
MYSKRFGGQYEPGGYASQVQQRSNMTQREGIQKFENERIKTLQEERLHIQKKTFTKWMNSFLIKVKMEVDDLFVDLADGVKLLKLLEIISGEKLGKPNSGRMRVHKIENVNKSLAFLHTKVRLESIGAEDIVDGNPRLILGLIWTIILRFQIQEIEIDVDEENDSSEKRSAKDALLLWCQRKTHGYQGVHIQDFTGSWRSGMGFNALIHSHRPDLFDYSSLTPGRHIENLNHAFDMADRELGIPKLLDAEDVDTTRPDEKSILTYVASYYHTFARMKNEQKSGKRIANIVGKLMDADRRKIHYEKLTTNLLEWIRMKTEELKKRNFPNSLEGIQKELVIFKQYITIEKPPKYKERSEIEALYFTINTLLKSLNQPQYMPQEGQLVNDIEKSWQMLEYAEHSREVDLREELLRQEKLEQLNYKFEKKSVLREGYLKEMIQVLSDPRYGANLRQVDATVKKHEAISADILARVERFNDLTAMADELTKENYHGKERVKKREEEVLNKWQKLLDLLENHKNNLTQMSNLLNMLREIDATMSTMKELQVQFASEDVGPHLLGVEELLQTHALQELQVTALGENLRRYVRQCQVLKQTDQKDIPLLLQKMEELNQTYEDLQRQSAERRRKLDDARNFYQFIEDYDNEESWVIDKQRICKAVISAKDLRAVMSLQQKHKALEDEIKVRKPKLTQITDSGRKLIELKHTRSAELQPRIDALEQHWKALESLVEFRKRQLEDEIEAYQFYTDANEAESWLNEKMALMASTDYGVDEPSAQALLQRHRDLQGELNAYSGDVLNLRQQAEKLIEAGINNLELSAEPEAVPEVEQEEWVNEKRLVPKEVWEDEEVEKVERRMVTENKMFPHVKALYVFEGQGMKMAKNEVMILLNKTNNDWWSVRKMDGNEGFVPATYVREIEARNVPCIVPKLEKVKTVQKVKKTVLVNQVVPVKRVRPTNVSQIKPLTKRRLVSDIVDGSESVEKRLKKICTTYDTLQDLAQRRHHLLEDSICLFGFFRECDDFEKWIKDKEKMLNSSDSNENVEIAKRKFEKFLTDLSASSKRIDALDAAVEDFIQQGHSQLDKIKARQKQIHQLWDHLNYLKAQKEKNLQGASSVELFNRTCDEAKDWMNEKMMQLDAAEWGRDLKTVQALQRRHQNLERELAPIQEKVNRVNLLANSVKSSYPTERANVTQRQNEIQEIWKNVQNKANERRARLENAVGQQIFENSSKNLLSWVEETNAVLNADIIAKDVETAKNLQKSHMDLGDEIRAKDDEFNEVIGLGTQLLQRNPKLELGEMIENLQQAQANIHEMWPEKKKFLEHCLELQVFNREADKIDATTKSHEAFIEQKELGTSLDEVDAILKRHADFENTLEAQNKILRGFNDKANRLIANEHYAAEYIDERRNQVLERRQAVREAAQRRKFDLQASKGFQQFAAEVEDLDTWLNEKIKIAGDQNYKDLSNLPRKIQKHTAFERELRANEGQLRNINKDAEALIATKNNVDRVEEMVSGLNKKWKDLIALSGDKGRRLEQAAAQRDHNRSIQDAKDKLKDLENGLQSDDVGHDLRSCRDLLKRHEIIETDIIMWEQKIYELVTSSEEMAHEGHFDARNIQKETKNIQKNIRDLKVPMEKRKQALEESLKYHKFGFELDTELQWINERLPTAKSEALGQNLHQAQSMYKKHRKLESEIEGHQPMITKALTFGEALIEQKHPESKKVEELCEHLKDSWESLLAEAAGRTKRLEISLKTQQYLFEASDIETWLGERNNLLRSDDYGRDRESATKLLTKHKALELELDTYSGIVSEMSHTAAAMVAAKYPDSKVIASKQQMIESMLKSLQKLAGQRQVKFMESLYRYEYFLEANELEQWINEQEQAVSSDDYGQDYEHLQELQNKFDDLKHHIESGTDRYKQCIESGRKLLNNESPYSAAIEKRQEELDVAWKSLLNSVLEREQKLAGAGEIHRFHRDVAEALFRIQDKNASLSSELGKDLNSALSLIRRHEGFENDLVALEAQLQVLVEDSVRLQTKYPSNAEAIAQQQQNVIESWNVLKEKSSLRNDQLAASYDLQSFLAQARDLLLWASNLRAALQAEEHVSDAAGATALKIQHDAIYGEIEAREEKFRELNELSDSMVQTGHYAAAEVEDKCLILLDERQKLHTAWNKKKILLEQKIDLFCFLRDAKQIDNICCSQEATLSTSDFGNTIEEVENQIKKHEAFEKLIQTQDEKVALLQSHGRKLVEQNHYDSANIQKVLKDVVDHRMKVVNLCAIRKQKLIDALLYAQFVSDCAEAEAWISEKLKKMEVDDSYTDVTSLEDKIKKLQKHQSFQAEVAANEQRIKEIQDKGDRLIKKKHESSEEIKQAVRNVLKYWNQLLDELSKRGRGLEEAQDILEFNNHLDKLEAWIRDKELMVNAGDTGRDLEHCMALRRKLDDVDSDMRVDDQRIKNINVLTDKLLSQGPKEVKNVEQRRDNLNSKWKALQGALNAYRKLLEGAYEIHVFNRDVNDTSERINEKALAMNLADVGRDLNAVEGLQRKQEALERDMTAIEQKLGDHGKEATLLIHTYPQRKDDIQAKLEEVHENWKGLQGATERKRDLLQNAYILHKYAADVREYEDWVNDIMKKMDSAPSPATIDEAEVQLELHQERKAEIDGRDEAFLKLQKHGKELVRLEEAKNIKMIDVSRNLETLESLHGKLHKAWQNRADQLKATHQILLFKAQADQIDRWLRNKEAFLNNDDLGDSFTSVDLLIKKHEAFEKLLNSNQIDDLKDFAAAVKSSKGIDQRVIEQRLEEIEARYAKLLASSAERKFRLQQSLQYQEFLRKLYEVEKWLHQKMQVALDENYREVSNLQSKIQKQTAFESELNANVHRINAAMKEGEKLIDEKHYASEEILAHLEFLETEWAKLQELSREKKERLAQAYDALIFDRSITEFNKWMDEVESHLSSEDYGKDLASVNNLLKKHEMLEADVAHHAETCESMKKTNEEFLRINHFMQEEIHDKVMASIKRYHSLHEPISIRRENIEDSQLLHQFLRDVDDELQFIDEKLPLAASTDLGNSLSAVQSLQKKHQALETEILSEDPIISSVIQRGHQMIRDNHYAKNVIESRSGMLQKKLVTLRDLASVRRLRLLDAVESQILYTEVIEAETWMKDKLPILASHDYGKDNDSVQSLQKKLESLQRELTAFKGNVEKIDSLAQGLIDRGHFDAENIAGKNETIKKLYEKLCRFSMEREKKLNESKKYFEFMREVDELHEFIHDQITVTASDEYGTDVEHVEQLIGKFDSFISNLTANEGRVMAVVAKGTVLLDEKNSYEVQISAKVAETKQLWDELKELVQARQEALAGAKQVHVYDRTADETISWINEKETALMSEDYGQDLETIQSLIRKHEVFETELEAVKNQMDIVMKEATKLADTFPDAKEHIEVKRDETVEAWTDLIMKTQARKEKLQQAEQLQEYFDNYRDLMAWINEQLANITAPDLALDVPGAEAQIKQLEENRQVIEARKDAFEKFYEAGKTLIDNKHFLANEVKQKVSVLEQRYNFLQHTLAERRKIYELNHDTRLFMREAEILENWINGRQSMVKDVELGDSIPQIEDLIKRHDDFEKTVSAQEEKFNAVKRITMLEQLMRKQKEEELAAQRAEKERLAKERLESIKQKEVQRITEERRKNEKQIDKNGPTDPANAASPYTVHSSKSLVMIPGQEPTTASPNSIPQATVQKSNSVTTFFGERLRRGSEGNIKRAESMKVGPKQPKRTPSFTTRRRAHSFRKDKDNSLLPPIEVQGFLERKHQLQSAGKRAPVRSWKTFYTILCGQLLCFFKDEEDCYQKRAATAPINILNAKCEKADDYTKRKNVFRLVLLDGSEFLFLAATVHEMTDWINKISFHAKLPPNLQLMSYDDTLKQMGEGSPDVKSLTGTEGTDASSLSSRTSSPDSQVRGSGEKSPSTPQINFLQRQKELKEQNAQPPHTGQMEKPPIPPRGAPPPTPQRQSSVQDVQLRNRSYSNGVAPDGFDDNSNYENQMQRPHSMLPTMQSGTNNGDEAWMRQSEFRQSDKPPPLPASLPPMGGGQFRPMPHHPGNYHPENLHHNMHRVHPAPQAPMRHPAELSYTAAEARTSWGNARHDTTSVTVRPISMPQDPNRFRTSTNESSSESESVQSSRSSVSGTGNGKEKKTGMFRIFSKKRKS